MTREEAISQLSVAGAMAQEAIQALDTIETSNAWKRIHKHANLVALEAEEYFGVSEGHFGGVTILGGQPK